MDVDQADPPPPLPAATNDAAAAEPHDPAADRMRTIDMTTAASPARPTQLASVQEEESTDASKNGENDESSSNTMTTANAKGDSVMDTEQQQSAAVSPGSDAAAAAAATNEQTQVAATLAGLASGSTSAAPSPVGPKPAPLPPGYNKDLPICANCATQTTPLWRRSHDSAHILCNACALFFKMKGRPRPISLKTDVIKSRNRSKGKSTSKDRASSTKRDGSENLPRSSSGIATSDTPPRKDASEDTEMADARPKALAEAAAASEDEATGRKARRAVPPGYGFVHMPGYPAPYYGYPYHPHFSPYPLPAARSVSRSRSTDRRAQSLDARPGAADPRRIPTSAPGAPAPFTPPAYNPGQPALDASSYYPSPYFPGAFGHPSPYYPGAPGMPPHAAAVAAAAAAQQAAASGGGYSPAHPGLSQPGAPPSQPPSRNRSPNATPAGSEGRPDSTRSSPEPSSAYQTNPITASAASAPPAVPAMPWPHPNPNMQHVPYAYSPLSAAHRLQIASNLPGSLARGAPVGRVSGAATPPELAMAEAAQRAAWAFNRSAGGPGGHPTRNGSSTEFSSHESSSNETVRADKSIASGVSAQARLPPVGDSALFGTSAAGVMTGRVRGTSVSSTSNSVSDRSEDGLRSPESTVLRIEERRGRPERRYEDGSKGKARDSVDVGESIDEEGEEGQGPGHYSASVSDGGRRMMGVESGFGELRVQEPSRQHNGTPGGNVAGSPIGRVLTDSNSRSRSSGQERGRSRGPHRSSSQSRAAARGLGSTDRRSSSSGRYSSSAEAEIARLKSKVAELTFLNGLMQSRLAQLDKPGSVPKHVVTSLTAETPRPVDDYEEDM
ncbi:GATA zinc finger protein 3 [Microbotryomycetes sp. JL221]|nr:GATA zinc finger protein 3 [Microbotryomycetes sp. JL221]